MNADSLHGALTGIVMAVVGFGTFDATGEWVLALGAASFVGLLLGTLWFGRPSA